MNYITIAVVGAAVGFVLVIAALMVIQ